MPDVSFTHLPPSEVRCANAFDRALEIEPDLEKYIREMGVQAVIQMVRCLLS